MALVSSWRPLRGTTAQWKARPQFIPEEGQIIAYTDWRKKIGADGTEKVITGFKFGDGKTYGIDLPFVNESVASEIEEELRTHVTNQQIHVSRTDRTKWDGKLNSTISGETLVLSNDL